LRWQGPGHDPPLRHWPLTCRRVCVSAVLARGCYAQLVGATERSAPTTPPAPRTTALALDPFWLAAAAAVCTTEHAWGTCAGGWTELGTTPLGAKNASTNGGRAASPLPTSVPVVIQLSRMPLWRGLMDQRWEQTPFSRHQRGGGECDTRAGERRTGKFFGVEKKWGRKAKMGNVAWRCDMRPQEESFLLRSRKGVWGGVGDGCGAGTCSKASALPSGMWPRDMFPQNVCDRVTFEL
jgi:hypothetical protein